MSKFTNIKACLIIAIICFIYSSYCVLAQGFFYPLQHGKTYLHTDNSNLPIILKDVRNKSPVFVLNKKGLFLNGKEFCLWADMSAKEYDMVFDKYCPIDTPIIATYSDHGVGTASLFIRVDEQSEKKIYMYFRGQKLLLEKDSLQLPYKFGIYNENERPM
ncbi:MAG: hypothetical protein ABL867_09690 [Rickettsiales bacterium]